jgi:hypothetical protein
MATITDNSGTIKLVNGSKTDYISKDGLSITANGDYIFLEELDGESHKFLYTEITSPSLGSAELLAATIAGYILESGGSGSDPDAVKLTGNQTVAGIKTFSSSPIVPTPTTDFQASTKKYVDDQLAAVIVDEDLKHVAADQTTTLNTAVDITGMVFAALANTKYRVQGKFRIGCNNSGGVKFAITVPGAATMFMTIFGFTTGAGVYLSSSVTGSGTLTTGAFCQVNSSNGWVQIDGTITTVGTAGNIQVQFASATSTQTSTIYSESYLGLTPLS